MSRRTMAAGGVLTAAVVVLAVRLPVAVAERAADYRFFDPIVDVVHLVDRHFLEEPDAEEMREAAIDGILESLGDPYTEYIPPALTSEFDKNIRGSYVGIGAEVNAAESFLRIVSPMDDSPAYKSGVEAEDLVVGVEGESTYEMPLQEVIDRLMGEPGTTVRVTIEREGTMTDAPREALAPSVAGPAEGWEGAMAPGPRPGRVRFDLDITRQRIRTQTIKGLHRDGEEWSYWVNPEQRIAYVRVTQFTETTVPALRSAVAGLVGQGLEGLILDLRFNTGGSLNAAIGMADLFLERGRIVSTKGRRRAEQTAEARPDDTFPRFPMVVLVNASSASASEIVAGALSDNGRAVIIGERTFGKGSVQGVYRLPSGRGQLKVTEQYYYLPSGRRLHRMDDSTEWGVDPTDGFYVPMTADENREMWRVRRDEEILRPADEVREGDWSNPAWILDHLKDPQLAAAVKAIELKLSTGDWTPTGEELPEGGLEGAALAEAERRVRLLERELERALRRADALARAAPEQEPRDLLPDDATLENGYLTITNSTGEVIARLRITGENLEPWLLDAPVEPTEEDAAGAADTAGAGGS